MGNSKADAKNTELLKLLAQLRDFIDIYLIIGLNVSALHQGAISRAFIGRLQAMALEALAISFCKVFEPSNRNDLNSIPGIIQSLRGLLLSEVQREDFAAFGRKYGNDQHPKVADIYINETFELFRKTHYESLSRLKDYRDKIGVHSEYGAVIDSLPSLRELETLFNFAIDFYRLIAESVHNVSTEVIDQKVARGLMRLMEQCGVKNPRSDLPVDEMISS